MSENSPVVVVGVDGSRGSVEALEWAVQYARSTDASLRVVLAWEHPKRVGYSQGVSPLPDAEPADQGREEAATDLLTAVIRMAAGESPPVPIERRVVQGPPAGVLIEEAASADLLVVGSRGHGAVTSLLIGSVSTQCVQHAPCPVVVVPAHKAAG
jgi:nucleotide-binding universal stress UspA family protein